MERPSVVQQALKPQNHGTLGRQMTCKLGFVYFRSDPVVYAASPEAQNIPNLLPKCLAVLQPHLKTRALWQRDKQEKGKASVCLERVGSDSKDRHSK